MSWYTLAVAGTIFFAGMNLLFKWLFGRGVDPWIVLLLEVK